MGNLENFTVCTRLGRSFKIWLISPKSACNYQLLWNIIRNMGIPKKPEPAKLIAGLIAVPDFLNDALKELEKTFGPITLKSEVIPFDKTNYYEPEMGKGLVRVWVAFDRLIEQDEIVEIKLRTNEIERKWMVEDKRKVNIDPGYITESKLVLATTKNYSHRIYLKDGIYAEVTLIYRKKQGFESLQWTYPDYREKTALEFFNRVREEYREDLKRLRARQIGLSGGE